jgi:predicted outer membrane repeat protein
MPSTLTVTSGADSGPGTLRAELAAAKSGDTIDFAVRRVNLTSGQLVINKSLTIQGPAMIGCFGLLSGPGKGSRLFEVDGPSTNVNMSGLTLERGGGTAFSFGANPQPNDHEGGAILNFGTLSLSNCTLDGNQCGFSYTTASEGNGGAIYNAGTLKVSGCTFDQNAAYGWVSSPNGLFLGINANGNGGAIYNAGQLNVGNSAFENDVATSEGGAIYSSVNATASFTNISVHPLPPTNVLWGGLDSFNDAAYIGGGIYNAGTMSISNWW